MRAAVKQGLHQQPEAQPAEATGLRQERRPNRLSGLGRSGKKAEGVIVRRSCSRENGEQEVSSADGSASANDEDGSGSGSGNGLKKGPKRVVGLSGTALSVVGGNMPSKVFSA